MNSFSFQIETSVLVFWPDEGTVSAVPLSEITTDERDIGCVCKVKVKKGKQEYCGKLAAIGKKHFMTVAHTPTAVSVFITGVVLWFGGVCKL